jgi:Domain of unknown function (DUF4157)
MYEPKQESTHQATSHLKQQDIESATSALNKPETHTNTVPTNQHMGRYRCALRFNQETGSNFSQDQQTLLQLQRLYGNQYVQKVLALAKHRNDKPEFAVNAEQHGEESEFASNNLDFAFNNFNNNNKDNDSFQAKEAEVTLGNFSAPNIAPPKVQSKIELQPHTASDSTLRSLAPIYQQGKVPVADLSGKIHAFDTEPANAATTGQHLEQIQQSYGSQGIERTLRGLSLTRGANFAKLALQNAPTAMRYITSNAVYAANLESETSDELFASQVSASTHSQNQAASSTAPVVGGAIAGLLAQSGAGQLLPQAIRSKLRRFTSDNLSDVRVHNDAAAHTAARLLGAKAFAVGRSIYFGQGELSPESSDGFRLLAHEVAHTIQQRNATLPASLQYLQVSAASDIAETAAEQFAEVVVGTSPKSVSLNSSQMLGLARVQRAISFSLSNNTITKNTMGIGESAAGFQIRPNGVPLFNWTTDVTINGNAGDPFANFEAGPHQVVRSFHENIHWGTGANHTHRQVSLSSLPIRDATAAGNTWYHDPFARAFSARGETQSTLLRDSPQSALIPWTNPVAGRAGNSGWFNYGVAFVAYISARDTTSGVGAGAFRALGNIYWNTAISGTFNAAQALGSRVSASGGTVNRSGVISGGSGEFPSMHGGAIANNSVIVTDT